MEKEPFTQFLTEAADETSRRGGDAIAAIRKQSADYFRALGFSEEETRALMQAGKR